MAGNRIHQLGSCLAYGDAITNHIFEIDQKLKVWGYESCIFSNALDDCYRGRAEYDRQYVKYIKNPNDLLIFHYSVYNENIKLYQQSKNKKIFIYHNITPPEFFIGYDGYYETMCRLGRQALSHLNECDFAVGDSEHNRLELLEAGFDLKKSDVLPIFLHCDSYDSVGANQRLKKRFQDMTNFLFVGRVAPNKKFEDLIKIFYYYNRLINDKSKLLLVGPLFLQRYNSRLNKLISQLDLKHKVIFTGRVPLQDLKAYYEVADIFVSMSEHEGFCVPLIESMYFNIPIVAYNSTAVPWTLDGAGVLVSKKDFAQVAEMINLILSDQDLQGKLIRTQRERFAQLQPAEVEKKLASILSRVGFEVNVVG